MDQLSQQQLTEALVVHTSHNLQPPTSLPRLSEHIQTFIQDVLREKAASLLAKPVIRPPRVRDDLPLVDYFVSSSHNTYLLSKQILGRSSAQSYAHVLSRGARCVEIDVWPSQNGPIVTHGHTFSQSIPFADVCLAIGSSVEPGSWPVIVSLECHVYGEQKQEELVKIMHEAWGDKFVDGKLDGVEDSLAPEMVMGRILVMESVEYYPPPITAMGGTSSNGGEGEEVPPSSSSSSSSSSESESESETSGIQSLWPRRKSRIPHHLRISPVLAEVGYYLRSMKPSKDWFSRFFPDPPNILLNISESSLLSLLTSSSTILNTLISHAQTHIRRIYPKGLRLTSSNLRPHPIWGTGSHVVALNWQTYDLGMQVNEAMFVGTPGWVSKPDWMRKPGSDGNEDGKRIKIRGEVVGVCSTPPPSDRERTADSKSYNAYIKAQLLLPAPSSIVPSSSNLLAIQTSNEVEYKSEAQSVQPITGDLNFAYPTVDKRNDPSSLDEEWDNLWWKKKQNEKGLSSAEFEWEIWQKWEELTFLRLTICEKEFGKDDTLAVFCARVADIRRAVQGAESTTDGGIHNRSPISGWRAVRLLDLTGKDCGAVALVRFTFA